MKNLILPALLALAPMTATAQIVPGPVCQSTQEALAEYANDYDEHPVWSGSSDFAPGGLLLISRHGTWTFLEIYDGDIVCFVTAGKGHSFQQGEPS